MISLNTVGEIKTYIKNGGNIQNGFIYEGLIMELTIVAPNNKIFTDIDRIIIISIRYANGDLSVLLIED